MKELNVIFRLNMEKDIQHANFWDQAVPTYIRENFVLINDSTEGLTKESFEDLYSESKILYPEDNSIVKGKTIILPTND